MYTAEIPEGYKKNFGGGMCSRDLDGNQVDPTQFTDYEHDDQLVEHRFNILSFFKKHTG